MVKFAALFCFAPLLAAAENPRAMRIIPKDVSLDGVPPWFLAVASCRDLEPAQVAGIDLGNGFGIVPTLMFKNPEETCVAVGEQRMKVPVIAKSVNGIAVMVFLVEEKKRQPFIQADLGGPSVGKNVAINDFRTGEVRKGKITWVSPYHPSEFATDIPAEEKDIGLPLFASGKITGVVVYTFKTSAGNCAWGVPWKAVTELVEASRK